MSESVYPPIDETGNKTLWNRTEILETNQVFQPVSQPVRHLPLTGQILITFFYVFGASANICSLLLLSRSGSTRNKKLALMIRCLTGNDLLALASSFVLMYMRLYLKPEVVTSRWFCGLRVLTRLFGFSSGSVASVMAVERYIALTRPFVYQKHITYKLIKRAIFSLWFLVFTLVFLPLLGFGLYFDPDAHDKRHICARYRYATKPSDIVYAYLVFTFGTAMCIVIVCCNLAVVRVLCRLGPTSMARRTTVNKDNRELAFNHTTQEELSFAKLMVVLCIFFVACWLPQMVTIIIAQVCPNLKNHPFYRAADVCTAFNFILDPVVYVLSRKPHRRGLRMLLKPLCYLCWLKHPDDSSRSNSQDSSSHCKASCVQALRLRTATGMNRVPHYGPIICHRDSIQSAVNRRGSHHLIPPPNVHQSDIRSRSPSSMRLSEDEDISSKSLHSDAPATETVAISSTSEESSCRIAEFSCRHKEVYLFTAL